jgi:hypothetical protein
VAVEDAVAVETTPALVVLCADVAADEEDDAMVVVVPIAGV